VSGEARWRFLVDRPAPYNPTVREGGTPDVPWGRGWTLGREGRRALVEVEANAAALEAYRDGTLPAGCRLAIQTEGRSAVEEHLDDRRPPRRLVVTAAGIRRKR
jgi:hypothetical protein